MRKKIASPTCLSALFVALFVVTTASAQESYKTKSASLPAPGKVDARVHALPPPSPQAELAKREAHLLEHYRPGPLVKLSPDALRAAPPPTAAATNVNPPAAAAVVRLNSNQPLSNVATGGITSHVDEPSVAVRGQEVLFTGNWYAAFSTNGGTSFSYMNPATTFPTIPNRDWCCDQVALYDSRHDLMFWFNQYLEDTTGNTVRLGVAHGSDIAGQQWRYYDFTPQGVGNWTGQWFDFPDLAVGEKYLYITSNVFTVGTNAFTRAVILRIPLDKLQSYQALTYDYFDTTQNFSLRPTQGATDTMYFASHVSENTLRVFTWPENGSAITSATAIVQPRVEATRSAPGPDHNDWLGRADSRITAAWVSGNTIGFGWSADRDTNFPWPQVRVAVLDRNTKAVLTQPHIWSPDFAYAYPAAAPNSNGRVGLSVAYGGGTHFPSHAIGVLDPSNSSWELTTTVEGTNGPSANRWGDYLSVRTQGNALDTWAATGYTLQGGSAPTNVEPRFLRFSLGMDLHISLVLVSPAPPHRLKKDEPGILQATVTSNGTGVPNKTVNFTADPHLLTIVQPSAITDENGIAKVDVKGATSSPGTVTAKAEVDGISATLPVKVPDLSLTGLGILLFVLLMAVLVATLRKRKPSQVI